ncbi:MAG: hypothetical protein OXI71_14035 [Gemmatimonadota bacterium]|nr:hypothetical protein [Gemmatimonadota bacterium]
MTHDVQAAKQRRQSLEKQLAEAITAEDQLVRPMVTGLVESLLDELEISFSNGEARKAVTASITDMLTRLLLADKITLDTAKDAVGESATIAAEWQPSTKVITAPWSQQNT